MKQGKIGLNLAPDGKLTVSTNGLRVDEEALTEAILAKLRAQGVL